MSSNRALSRPLLVLAGTGLVLLSGACSTSNAANSSGDKPRTKPGATVSTALLAFDPKTVNIHTGQTVTWVGGDNITHVLVEGTYAVGSDGLRTTESDDKAFHLDLSRKGQQVSHTYGRAGTFTYYCTIHHGMNGSVVVS